MTDSSIPQRAFLALLIAIVLVALAPIAVTGIMGKVMPDSLIAVSDKCLTGLVGVLGTLAGMGIARRKEP